MDDFGSDKIEVELTSPLLEGRSPKKQATGGRPKHTTESKSKKSKPGCCSRTTRHLCRWVGILLFVVLVAEGLVIALEYVSTTVSVATEGDARGGAVALVGEQITVCGSINHLFLPAKAFSCRWCEGALPENATILANNKTAPVLTCGEAFDAKGDDKYVYVINSTVAQRQPRVAFHCRLRAWIEWHTSEVVFKNVAAFVQAPLNPPPQAALSLVLTGDPNAGPILQTALLTVNHTALPSIAPGTLVLVPAAVAPAMNASSDPSSAATVLVVVQNLISSQGTAPQIVDIYNATFPIITDIFSSISLSAYTALPETEADVVRVTIPTVNGTFANSSSTATARESPSAYGSVDTTSHDSDPSPSPQDRNDRAGSSAESAGDFDLKVHQFSLNLADMFSISFPEGLQVSGGLDVSRFKVDGSLEHDLSIVNGTIGFPFRFVVHLDVDAAMSFQMRAEAPVSFNFEYIPGGEKSGVFSLQLFRFANLFKDMFSKLKIQFPIGLKVVLTDTLDVKFDLALQYNFRVGVNCPTSFSDCEFVHEFSEGNKTSMSGDSYNFACDSGVDLSIGFPRVAFQPWPILRPSLNFGLQRHVFFDALTPGQLVIHDAVNIPFYCSSTLLALSSTATADISLDFQFWRIGIPIFDKTLMSFDPHLFYFECISNPIVCNPKYTCDRGSLTCNKVSRTDPAGQSLQLCQSQCKTTYNCAKGQCVAVQGSSGSYNSLSDCTARCGCNACSGSSAKYCCACPQYGTGPCSSSCSFMCPGDFWQCCMS